MYCFTYNYNTVSNKFESLPMQQPQPTRVHKLICFHICRALKLPPWANERRISAQNHHFVSIFYYSLFSNTQIFRRSLLWRWESCPSISVWERSYVKRCPVLWVRARHPQRRKRQSVFRKIFQMQTKFRASFCIKFVIEVCKVRRATNLGDFKSLLKIAWTKPDAVSNIASNHKIRADNASSVIEVICFLGSPICQNRK